MLVQILTAMSVIITAIYAWLTYQILKANRATVQAMEAQSMALTRPYIAVSAGAERGSILFLLTIANTGSTSAERVSLTMDRPFHQFGDSDKNIANMNAFVGVIPSFPPRFELNFHLGTSIQIYGGERANAPMPQTFTVTATYHSSSGHEFVEATTVDLRALYGTAVVKDRGVDELKEITVAVKSLAR
jgi:hypothetical protein